jgi:hypothetical protein
MSEKRFILAEPTQEGEPPQRMAVGQFAILYVAMSHRRRIAKVYELFVWC